MGDENALRRPSSSSTGKPGGRETGQSMADYPQEGGIFLVKYSCPDCHANAWGKPGLDLICGACWDGKDPVRLVPA